MGTHIDLRDDQATIEKLTKLNAKPITREEGEKIAEQLGAVKYVECSPKTQVAYMYILSKKMQPGNRISIHFIRDFQPLNIIMNDTICI